MLLCKCAPVCPDIGYQMPVRIEVTDGLRSQATCFVLSFVRLVESEYAPLAERAERHC